VTVSSSVVVTGAASGIGAGIARAFSDAGWAVVGIDVQDASAGIEIVTGDVRDRAAHERAAAAASAHAPLRAWVNCAGIAEEASVHEATAEHVDRVLGVNLIGVFWGCAVAVETMLASGGSIVNISSGQALRGRDRYPAYAASKGGILALTTQVAAEYADRGIRCNAIVPGVIETAMNAQILSEAADPAAVQRSWDVLSPIGRLGTPADIAALSLFLAGDDSGFITGAAIPVDGGQLVIPPDRALRDDS
jgi:NAD(P)-dependent dehydrogenase (short-subunit alcohol dehydrogenase family)